MYFWHLIKKKKKEFRSTSEQVQFHYAGYRVQIVTPNFKLELPHSLNKNYEPIFKLALTGSHDKQELANEFARYHVYTVANIVYP